MLGSHPFRSVGEESLRPAPALQGEHRGLDMLRHSRDGKGTKAVMCPNYRGNTAEQPAAGKKAPGLGNGPGLLTGRAGGRQSSISPPHVWRQGLSPSLQGCPSPGSQRSTTAKGQRQQRPSPAYRAVAQHKGTEKVPWGCQECPLPRGPLVPPLQLQPAPLLFWLALASPFHS